MSTKTVEVRDPQATLLDLLAKVREGVDIVLADGATPVARLVPLSLSTTPRKAALHAGSISTSADFDEPLADDFWVRPERDFCWIRMLSSGGIVSLLGSPHKC